MFGCDNVTKIYVPKPLNETGLLPGMGKLNDFSSYSYVYMYQSGP